MSLTLNKILVLCALLISAMLPGWSWAESAWQDSSDTVGEFNGTVPTADSASIPVYQGSVFLDPTKTHEVAFTAKPSEFNADVSVSKLLVTNPQDREGDIIATPRWENQTPPAIFSLGGCRHAGHLTGPTASRRSLVLCTGTCRAFAGRLGAA